MSNPTELPLPNIYEQTAILGSESQCRDLLLEISRRAKPEGEAPQGEPAELIGVREQIEKGAGFWHACSGCHDTEDGHPTGPYAYSSTMGCALGNGCSECGGIGAVWDNNDYESMAQDWDALDDAPTAQQAEGGPAAVGCDQCEDGYIYDTSHTRREKCRHCAALAAQQATALGALPDQSQFEAQARYQGATNFEPVHPDFMVCNNGWTPATYRDPMTELAWRVWANKRTAPSAPGTPEAPKVDWICEDSECGWGWKGPASPAPLCSFCAREMERAAHLDGGQGEGA